MPGGTVSWQEEQESIFTRFLLLVVLLGVYFGAIVPFQPQLLLAGIGLLVLQNLVSLLAVPRRLAWLPLFSFVANRAVLVCIIGSTGGLEGMFAPLVIVMVALGLVWYNDPRSVLLLGSSQLGVMLLGNLLAYWAGFVVNWAYFVVYIAGLLIILRALSKPLAQLSHSAYTDSLTKVFNRGKGLEELQHWISEGKSFALIFVDVSRFKQFNDTYGHAVGDEVLVWIADTLKQNLHGQGLVMRYGGDEFILATKEDTAPLLKRLEQRLGKGFIAKVGRLHPSINLGEVCFPSEAQSLADLIRMADERMYRHKAVRLRLTES